MTWRGQIAFRPYLRNVQEDSRILLIAELYFRDELAKVTKLAELDDEAQKAWVFRVHAVRTDNTRGTAPTPAYDYE